MELDDEFKSAADRATKLSKRPPNDIMLQLYALYKQGNNGDVIGDRPGFADFENRVKYDSWSKLKGKSEDDAKKEYITLVNQLEQEDIG